MSSGPEMVVQGAEFKGLRVACEMESREQQRRLLQPKGGGALGRDQAWLGFDSVLSLGQGTLFVLLPPSCSSVYFC